MANRKKKPAEVAGPVTAWCHRCDFGTGMDTCHVCDGTGMVLWAGDKCYPNTKEGFEKAKAAQS